MTYRLMLKFNVPIVAILLGATILPAQESKPSGFGSLVKRCEVASLTDSGTLVHHYLWFAEQYRETANGLSENDRGKLDRAINKLSDELKKGALTCDTLFVQRPGQVRQMAGTKPHWRSMKPVNPEELKKWNELAGTGFKDAEEQSAILKNLVKNELSKMECFAKFQQELAAYSFIVLSPKQLVEHADLLIGKVIDQKSSLAKLQFERDQKRFDRTEIDKSIRRSMLDEIFEVLTDSQKTKFAGRLGLKPSELNQILDSPFGSPALQLRLKSRNKLYGGLPEELGREVLERQIRNEEIRFHVDAPEPSSKQLERVIVIFTSGLDYSTPFLNDFWCDEFSPEVFQGVEFLDYQKEELNKYRAEWKEKRDSAETISGLIQINNEYTKGLNDILLPGQSNEYFARFVAKTGLLVFLTRDDVAREYEISQFQRKELLAAREKVLNEYPAKLAKWIRKTHSARVKEVFEAMNLDCQAVTGFTRDELAEASVRCPNSSLEKRGKFMDKKTYVWSYWWERRKAKLEELKK